jgi:hypothetical protein
MGPMGPTTSQNPPLDQKRFISFCAGPRWLRLAILPRQLGWMPPD